MLFKKWASTLTSSICYESDTTQHKNGILHFSDLPSFVYGEIALLINKLQPAYVIITGDLCDNIQLRLYPSKLMKYERNLFELANILRADSIQQVYICPSKEDSIHSIRKCFPKAEIIAPGQKIHIQGKSFTLAHLGQDVLSSPSTFNLYGHDRYLQSHETDQKHYLNGLENIHWIDIDSWKITKFDYPMGTNSTRTIVR